VKLNLFFRNKKEVSKKHYKENVKKRLQNTKHKGGNLENFVKRLLTFNKYFHGGEVRLLDVTECLIGK